MEKIALPVLMFMWTFTSYICHFQAKTFIRNMQSTHGHGISAFSVTMITTAQLLFCFVSFNFSDTRGTKSSLKSYIILLTHGIATLLTNSSMAMTFAASTFTVKLTEPVTSALAQRLYLGESMSVLCWISLPVIISGALIFANDSMGHLELSTGSIFAFLSNLVLSGRNVILKKQQYSDVSVRLRQTQGCTILLAVILTCASLSHVAEATGIKLKSELSVLCLSVLLSSLFHALYSYISTALILERLGVTEHAIANIIKRLFVVLLLYTTGSRIATTQNFIGLGICFLGLLMYTWSRTEKSTLKQSTFAIARWKYQILIAAVCVITVVPNLKYIENTVYYRITETVGEPGATANLNQSDDAEVHFRANSRNANLMNDMDDKQIIQSNITEYNRDVNKLSRTLSKNIDIIQEAQRIHLKLFRSLLGKYKYAMLLFIPTFENKGDPAIAVGQLHLLRKLGLTVIFHSVTFKPQHFDFARNLSRFYSDQDLVILLHGGGNVIGYPVADFYRKQAILTFPNFELILFPQSIWLRNDVEHIAFCKKLYAQHSRLTMVFRDRTSLDIGQKLFPKVRSLLSPDMAFEMGYVPRFMPPSYDILWLKRSDTEALTYHVPPSIGNYSIHVADWLKWPTPKSGNSMEEVFLITTNGLMFLQRGRVVVADRLHGHILTTLLGIPHVLIDTVNNKVSSYHNTWTKGLDNTILVNSTSGAKDKVIELLKKYDQQLPKIVGYIDSITVPNAQQKRQYSKLRPEAHG